jgi:hypothetical protein
MNNIIIGIIIFELLLLITIYFLLPSIKETSKTITNPSNTSSKVKCSQTKQSCQTDNDCSNTCTEEQLSCVSTDNYGKVCLPSVPDSSCNKEKGGIPIWSGYGMTDDSRWSCICQYPEYYNGPNCESANPYYCTDGQIDPTKPLQDESCICPEGTTKMFRASTNVPFCAQKDGQKGGGEYGLLGNIYNSPDWRNISIQSVNWEQKIYDEMYKNLDKDNITGQIYDIIYDKPNNKYKSLVLTPDLATKICAIIPKPDNLCDIPFPPNKNEMIYTYYTKSYF